MNIFDLQATISLNADSLLSGLEEAQTSFEGLNDSVSDTARDISSAFSQLEQPISNASTMLADVGEAASDAAYGMDEIEGSVDGASSGLDEISESASNAGGELSEAGNAAASAGNDAENSAPKWGSLKDALGGVASAAGLITAGIAGAAAGAFKIAKDAAYAADDLNTLSKQTGISTDELQKFQYASDLIDVSMDTFTGSLTKLTRNMYSAKEGSGSAADAFELLGIAITNEDGSLRNNQDVFYEVIDALSSVENYTERDAIAMEVFGRSAQDLNPLILGGSEALKELGQQAEDAGLILSQDALDGLNQLSDALDTAKATSAAFTNVLGTAFASTIAEAITTATSFAQEMSSAFSEGFDTGGIEGALAAVGEVISGKLSEISSEVAEAVPSLTGPVSDLAGAFVQLKDAGIEAVSGSIQNFLDAFEDSSISSIIDDIATAAGNLFNDFLIAGESVINGIADGIKKFFDVFDESAAVEAIESVAGVIADLFAPFSDALGSAIKSAGEGLGDVASNIGELAGHLANGVVDKIKDLADNFEKWAPWVAAVAAGFVTMQVLSTIVPLITTLKTVFIDLPSVTQLASSAMSVLSGVLSSFGGPIGIAITAAVALTTALVTAYNTNEEFRNSVDAVLKTIADGVKAAFGAVSEFFTDTLPEAFRSFVDMLGDVANQIGVFFTETLPAKFDELVNILGRVVDKIKDIGKNIVEGLKQGILGAWDSLTSWFGDLCNGLVSGVMWIFGERSPSRVFAGIGKNLVVGMEQGWGREFGTLERQVSRDLESLTGDAKKVSFADSALGRSSAAGISSLLAASDSGRSKDPVAVNLMLNGDTLATVLYDPIRRVAQQKGQNTREVAYA